MNKRSGFNEYLKAYRRTPKGKASQMWTGIIGRCGNKFGNAPSYANIKVLITREEFMAWAVPLLEEWIKTDSISTASIDREDNKKHYSLDNLQIISRHDNTLKQDRYKNVGAPSGYAWCSICKDYKLTKVFNKDKYSFNGFTSRCKPCIAKLDHNRYKKKMLTRNK